MTFADIQALTNVSSFHDAQKTTVCASQNEIASQDRGDHQASVGRGSTGEGHRKFPGWWERKIPKLQLVCRSVAPTEIRAGGWKTSIGMSSRKRLELVGYLICLMELRRFISSIGGS